MSDPKCARMLLGAAERDVLTLRNITAGAPDESYGFHLQQAAEKSLKAWLALLGETYPLTHNLETLVNLLAGRDVDVEAHRELTVYTPYAVEFRYGVSTRVPNRSIERPRSPLWRPCLNRFGGT